MNKDARVYLAQILERIERIEQYTVGGRQAFFAEPLIQDGVIRNFEVIGEAAKRIPAEYKQQHPAIPWKSLTAFRDVLIHQYEGIGLSEVWNVIEGDVPGLKRAIGAILPPLDQLERELAGDAPPADGT